MSNERGKNINMHWIKTINLLYALAFDQLMPQLQTSVHYIFLLHSIVSALVIDYYSCCMLQLELSLVHAPSVSLISASRSYHLHCTKTVGGSIYM